MGKYVGKQNVIINVGGKSTWITEGEIYDFDKKHVEDAVRGNYIAVYRKPRRRNAAAEDNEDAGSE